MECDVHDIASAAKPATEACDRGDDNAVNSGKGCMEITTELKRVLEAIEPGFFGSIEIGVQNGYPGTAKITTTYKLTTSRENREHNGDRAQSS